MGRPPLNLTRTHVGLPPETLARIDALVGPQKRSDFIREALEAALRVAEIAAKAQAKDE